MLRCLPALLAVALCLTPPRGARADVFVLANGGQIEGRLLNPDQKPREQYVVEMPGGGQITLNKSQVERVEDRSAALQWYQTAAPQVPHTVAGQWAIAEQCKERNLKAQREFHLQRILELDPEHKDARYALGYSRVDGRWVRPDELMVAQGYVRYRGAWRIAQDVALEQIADRDEKQVRDWRQKLKTWGTWIAKRRGNEQAAVEAIRAIDDPAAAPALAEIVTDADTPNDVKKLCIAALGKLQAPAAVHAFIDRALNDRDVNVRDACLDQLAKFGTAQAVSEFQKLLRSPDNQKVNRGAACLAALRRPEATLPLINALVTEHKFLVPQGGSPGSLNLGFGGGPGGGGNAFGVGGRPKLVTKQLHNEQVLNALVAIHPGVNFGYDVARWQQWYTDQFAPPTSNLRRLE